MTILQIDVAPEVATNIATTFPTKFLLLLADRQLRLGIPHSGVFADDFVGRFGRTFGRAFHFHQSQDGASEKKTHF